MVTSFRGREECDGAGAGKEEGEEEEDEKEDGERKERDGGEYVREIC